MAPARCTNQGLVSPPSYHQTMATALHVDALTLVTSLHLLEVCCITVQLAQQQCPTPLAAGPGRAPRVYSEASLLLVALLRTLWRLPYQEVHDWLCAWPALALACGLLLGTDGQPRVPSIERFFGRVLIFFHLQRPPVCRRSLVGQPSRRGSPLPMPRSG